MKIKKSSIQGFFKHCKDNKLIFVMKSWAPQIIILDQ